jgi:hypothetical protein
MVRDGPLMAITPFLTLKIRGKKDAVLARQRSRRIATLLSFDPHEQACIAAGSFVIACQALVLFSKARLCFQIDNHQLQIFAQEAKPDANDGARPISGRLAGLLPEMEGKMLFRLTKLLPPQENAAETLDLAWLVREVEKATCNSLFDEIIKQNQEVLALLHEVRLHRDPISEKEKKSANHHAA